MLDLVCIEDYGLEGKNRYFINATKFGITRDELKACGVHDERAYLNQKVCAQLALLNRELNTLGLKIVIKDAYRSEDLYKLIMKKRKEKEGAEFVKNSFNTKGDFPHASGNSVDIAFVSIKTNEQVLCVKSIEDINERRKSWSTGYYQNSTDSQEQEIHQNRLLMKSMMQKYGFEGIPHEYWHFNFIGTN